jgi:hypothetical protein
MQLKVWAEAAAKVPPVRVMNNSKGLIFPSEATNIDAAVVISSKGIIRGLVN